MRDTRSEYPPEFDEETEELEDANQADEGSSYAEGFGLVDLEEHRRTTALLEATRQAADELEARLVGVGRERDVCREALEAIAQHAEALRAELEEAYLDWASQGHANAPRARVWVEAAKTIRMRARRARTGDAGA